MQLNAHRLSGDKVKFVPTTKTSGKFSSGAMDTVIVHFTASPTCRSALGALTNPSVKASAHLLVDHDGSIIQMVDFDTIAWHAGRSVYKGRKSFNKYSIGIEVVNRGPLRKKNGKYYDIYNKVVSADEVVRGKHRNNPRASAYWHKYTPEQIKATEEIIKQLQANYDIKYILGHEEISVGRKIDPGPAFPLDEMRDRLMSDTVEKKDESFSAKEVAFVTASSLNLREAATGSSDKICKALQNGTKVIVLEDQGNWCKIATKITGWMTRKYIELDNSDDFYDGIVTASSLNIREEDSGDSEKVAKPFPRGTKIIILEQRNEWYRVLAPVVGFVAKKYLSKKD